MTASKNQPSKEQAARLLCGLFLTQFGVTVSYDAMIKFINENWTKLEVLAHSIHDAEKADDAPRV